MSEKTTTAEPTESKNDRKRAEIVARVAEYLLSHGFEDSGIRSLAASAGISNRMLMYYFSSKDELVLEALLSISKTLAEQLDMLLPQNTATQKEIVDTMLLASEDPATQMLIKLFFETAGLGVRGASPYRAITQRILERWQSWIEQKLRADQKTRAPEILAQLEGQLFVNLFLTP